MHFWLQIGWNRCSLFSRSTVGFSDISSETSTDPPIYLNSCLLLFMTSFLSTILGRSNICYICCCCALPLTFLLLRAWCWQSKGWKSRWSPLLWPHLKVSEKSLFLFSMVHSDTLCQVCFLIVGLENGLLSIFSTVSLSLTCRWIENNKHTMTEDFIYAVACCRFQKESVGCKAKVNPHWSKLNVS